MQDKNPLTDGKVNGVGGGKYGMLINRVAHHQEAAKWDMGASMVFLAASLEQDNYIFTSHITDRWRKLLLQREFATKLKAYLGDDVMKKLVAWLDVIDGAPLDNMSAFMNLSHWQGFFTGERVYSSNMGRQILDVEGVATQARKLYRHHADEREMTWEQYFQTITGLLRASGAGFGAFSRSGSEALSSFGSLALSDAAGANVSRAGKDILCTVGLLDRPKKKGSAKSRTKTKAGQRTKRKK